MGGKNHQPCRSYLVNSTKLSRAMSLAFVNLELANVSLEDLILLELNGEQGQIGEIVCHLEQSENHLHEMQNVLSALCQQMKEVPFQDLPTLFATNLERFGEQMTNEGLHKSTQEWQIAANCMQERGFWGMTSIISDRVNTLTDLTAQLKVKVSGCTKIAEEGTVHIALEENSDLNFKQEFAQLYTAWASFQQLFLASSLISTELWYRFNKFGSLLQQPEKVLAVA